MGPGFESLPGHHTLRGVAQLASAPRSGRGGRKFESSHPDQFPSLFLFLHRELLATLAQLVEQRIRNA